jgi:hypothetical protein
MEGLAVAGAGGPPAEELLLLLRAADRGVKMETVATEG